MLRISRYIATFFALCLAVGETALNWGHWQFWPLWVVDYAIVVWLLVAVWLARRPSAGHHLATAWAFAAGVFYIALFGGLDDLRRTSQPISESAVLLSLIGSMLVLSLIGLGCSIIASWKTPEKERQMDVG
ncbi:MAG: hypothetical protein HY735_16555 [Verrucomicrobia bacterium]|nr:hypothetical protein [Verrucomicrobiota bacterium]